jgi:hypothetical protein
MMISAESNARFLRKIEPFIKDNMVCAPIGFLCRLTKLSRRRLFRYLNHNGLTLDSSQKHMRSKMDGETKHRVVYIKCRIKQNPDITIQALGDELGCSRQSVSQLMHRYGIKK